MNFHPKDYTRHSPTGYCKYCGAWVGYTPKDNCPEYGDVKYRTDKFNTKLSKEETE